MTEKDIQTRKQWLFALIAYAAISLMSTFQAILFGPQEIPYPFVLFLLLSTLLIVFLVCYGLYRCAYRKPGTKFLTTMLIIVPISMLGSIVVANVMNLPIVINVWTIAGNLSVIALYVMNWKMLKMNKRLKAAS